MRYWEIDNNDYYDGATVDEFIQKRFRVTSFQNNRRIIRVKKPIENFSNVLVVHKQRWISV